MNFKVNRDGTYEVGNLRVEKLPQLLRLIKQNETWRKEDAELNIAQVEEVEKDLTPKGE